MKNCFGRQIYVHPDDRRDGHYKLNTVTYGKAPNPYFAIRFLRQLDLDAHSTPNAQRAILQDFYVDDLLTGADTISQVLELRDEIIQTLKGGRFKLAKWVFNDIRLIPTAANYQRIDINLIKQGDSKTLGFFMELPRRHLKIFNRS